MRASERTHWYEENTFVEAPRDFLRGPNISVHQSSSEENIPSLPDSVNVKMYNHRSVRRCSAVHRLCGVVIVLAKRQEFGEKGASQSWTRDFENAHQQKNKTKQQQSHVTPSIQSHLRFALSASGVFRSLSLTFFGSTSGHGDCEWSRLGDRSDSSSC